MRKEDVLRNHKYYDGSEPHVLRERHSAGERALPARNSNSTPDAVDASTAYRYRTDAAAMAFDADRAALEAYSRSMPGAVPSTRRPSGFAGSNSDLDV